MLNQQKGLSLIGVLVAIFITTIGLMASLALANMSIKGSSLGEMKLIASGLAQEGVEIVRDTRRAHPDWIDWEWYGDGGSIATSSSQNFVVQYNQQGLMSFVNTPLSLAASGFYVYDADPSNNTEFYRKVTLTKVSFEELKVVVEIKWQLKGNWYYLIVQDELWNWK